MACKKIILAACAEDGRTGRNQKQGDSQRGCHRPGMWRMAQMGLCGVDRTTPLLNRSKKGRGGLAGLSK